ncbi:MAG: PAS domain S-box protein [Chloroflexi bacterium]|nr:PAS domain S-box protein [Chloroflexota bacterium]
MKRPGEGARAPHSRATDEASGAISPELALDSHSSLLETILDTMSESVYVADPSGNLLVVNRSFASLIGARSKEEASRSLAEYRRLLKPRRPDGAPMPPEEMPMSRALRGESFTNAVVLITPFGGRGDRYLSVSGAPIRDATGNVVAALSVARDITESKKAEEALRESEQRFRKVFEEGPLGMAIVGLDYRFVSVNPMLCRMVGYTEQELMSLTFPDITHLEDVDKDVALAAQLFRGEIQHYTVDKRYVNKNGMTLWINLTASLIRGADGQPLYGLGMIQDITERKRAEQFREEYVWLVSHDLRNPLQIVQGQAQMIQRFVDLEDVVRASATSIVSNAKRINLMIQDLVDSARLETGQLELEKETVDLRSLVLELLKPAKGVVDVERIRVDMPAGLPAVDADPDRLERILTNLLTNALKYSEHETEVTLKAGIIQGEMLVSVTDRGPGITRKDLPHLFERFYRARGARRVEGLGLGLYATKMLVEAHGGRIWVESEVGKGTTLYFTLALDRGRV